MSLRAYNAVETAYISLQYCSYALKHPEVSLEQYCSDIYAPKLAESFRKSWDWLQYVGLESVLEGE